MKWQVTTIICLKKSGRSHRDPKLENSAFVQEHRKLIPNDRIFTFWDLNCEDVDYSANVRKRWLCLPIMIELLSINKNACVVGPQFLMYIHPHMDDFEG